MFEKEIFAARLRELRKSKGVSREALASVLGLTYFSVAKMENGERACSVEVLFALSRYFEVSADYLIGLADEPTLSS